MSSKQLQEIEIKVAFLEDALSQLSDEHYQQQRELETLKTQYASLQERIQRQDNSDNGPSEASDERPPHY